MTLFDRADTAMKSICEGCGEVKTTKVILTEFGRRRYCKACRDEKFPKRGVIHTD